MANRTAGITFLTIKSLQKSPISFIASRSRSRSLSSILRIALYKCMLHKGPTHNEPVTVCPIRAVVALPTTANNMPFSTQLLYRNLGLGTFPSSCKIRINAVLLDKLPWNYLAHCSTDRWSPQISRPDSESNPSELAAWTLEASIPTRRSAALTSLAVLSASLHTVGLKVP